MTCRVNIWTKSSANLQPRQNPDIGEHIVLRNYASKLSEFHVAVHDRNQRPTIHVT